MFVFRVKGKATVAQPPKRDNVEGGPGMKAKGFFITVLAGVLLCFGVFIALLSIEDPFFVLGGIEEGETALFDNQRYQMAGLIRHQDYSAVVMGTSLVANYRASWFADGLGEETLKITFPDGWITEFDTALELAFCTHPQLDQVFFCLDPNILIRPDSQRTVELPRYLYNSNPLDDVEYLLNAETYFEAAKSWVRRHTKEATTLDEAYVWDSTHTFSRIDAVMSYPRPELRDTALPDDAYLEAADENLGIICGWIEAHPDVRFHIWFPPYSILYWDKTIREGTADAILTAVEHAAVRLMDYRNVSVHSFLFSRVASDLNNYTDHIHASGTVNAWVTRTLLEDERRLTRENYLRELEGLREFIHAYDYEAIFN